MLGCWLIVLDWVIGLCWRKSPRVVAKNEAIAALQIGIFLLGPDASVVGVKQSGTGQGSGSPHLFPTLLLTS